MSLETLLAAIHSDPADELAWDAVADCLEERGQPERAELTRLTHSLRRSIEVPDREALEARVQRLLAAGVLPCVAEVTNSIGMRLALIPPGEFLMGSPVGEGGRAKNEGPRHRVRISRAFYLGVFAVTQAEYAHVTGKNPSYFSAGGEGKEEVLGLNTSRFPVEQVSCKDAVTFCGRLSGLTGEKRNDRLYRLPSEAEWEYACRAGTTTPFHTGAALSPAQANFNGNHPYGGAEKGAFLSRTSEVGAFGPNAFGLYDMHGNVYEWCSDRYGEDYYRSSPLHDPTGPSEGSERVVRGGCWGGSGSVCRSAFRVRERQGYGDNSMGFRVAVVPRGQ